MQSLEHFAHAPQESDGYQRNNTTIAPEIITYLKDECDLREFFVPKPMQGVLSKSFRIEKEEGVAVQIAGNAEVPRAENVQKLFTIYLHRNATGYKIDDDERKMNSDDPGYEARKMENAMKRMLKKERLDMTQVFLAAPGGVTNVTGGLSNLNVSVIKAAVDAMIASASVEDDIEPTMLFMSYAAFRQLQADPDFKYIPEVFQKLLLEGRFMEGGRTNKRAISGPTGQYIDGIEIYIVNELGNDIILLDETKDALWLAEDQQPTITSYRDYEHISDIVDIRHDQQPVCVRPEALYKIHIQ